jgi:hypothetical protein
MSNYSPAAGAASSASGRVQAERMTVRFDPPAVALYCSVARPNTRPIAFKPAMPIHFAIDRQNRLVAYVVEGTATTEEARAFLDAVMRHPHYRYGFDFFGDRRDVDAAPEPNYIFAVAAEVNARAARLAPCRWAVIVDGEVAHGMARMWGLLAAGSGVDIRPFHSAADAREWLSLAEDYSPLERVNAARAVPGG